MLYLCGGKMMRFTESLCADCKYANEHPHSRNYVICYQGYGRRWNKQIACSLFTDQTSDEYIEQLAAT